MIQILQEQHLHQPIAQSNKQNFFNKANPYSSSLESFAHKEIRAKNSIAQTTNNKERIVSECSQSLTHSPIKSEDIEDRETQSWKESSASHIYNHQIEVQAVPPTRKPRTSSAHSPSKEQVQPKIMTLEDKDQPMTPKKNPLIKDIFFKNRCYLYGWVRNECVKFKIQTQTFANSVHLMDTYYACNCFDQASFIRQVLCMIIISTKALEPKVLYTSTVARNNKLSFQQTLQTECRIFDWFDHRISSHNFVRLASQYMKRWDDEAEQKRLDVKILAQSQESFVLYNNIIYFCECQLRIKKALLQRDIKRIFKFIIGKGNRVEQDIIDHIFKEPFLSEAEQHKYAYEIAEEEEKEEERTTSFRQWEGEYEKKSESVRNRFNEFTVGDNYGHFLSLIF